MNKHGDIPLITSKTRICIRTCSSGTGWRLIVGPHPFGKNGGTRGSLRTNEPKWVDGVDVAGSGRPSRRVPGPDAGKDLVMYAISVLGQIAATGDGEAFLYGLETRNVLQDALGSKTAGEMADKIDDHFNREGKAFVKTWRGELSSPVTEEAPSSLHLNECVP